MKEEEHNPRGSMRAPSDEQAGPLPLLTASTSCHEYLSQIYWQAFDTVDRIPCRFGRSQLAPQVKTVTFCFGKNKEEKEGRNEMIHIPESAGNRDKLTLQHHAKCRHTSTSCPGFSFGESSCL